MFSICSDNKQRDRTADFALSHTSFYYLRIQHKTRKDFAIICMKTQNIVNNIKSGAESPVEAELDKR